MSTTAPNAGVFAFPTSAHHPAASPERTKPVTETPTEPAIDHGLEESFPASDPVSVSVSKAVHPASHDSQGACAMPRRPGGRGAPRCPRRSAPACWLAARRWPWAMRSRSFGACTDRAVRGEARN
jgi:hypothetical protein